MHLYRIDGAVHRKAEDETAWNCRNASWSMVIAAVGADPGHAPTLKKWAKNYWEAVHPFNLGGALPELHDGRRRRSGLRATYGDNYKRLGQLKKKYDPGNLFRVNQNIPPAA
jgi:FAD/FMN-containing dehydrogenase